MIFLLVCVKSPLPVDGLLWLHLHLNFDRVAYFFKYSAVSALAKMQKNT